LLLVSHRNLVDLTFDGCRPSKRLSRCTSKTFASFAIKRALIWQSFLRSPGIRVALFDASSARGYWHWRSSHSVNLSHTLSMPFSCAFLQAQICPQSLSRNTGLYISLHPTSFQEKRETWKRGTVFSPLVITESTFRVSSLNQESALYLLVVRYWMRCCCMRMQASKFKLQNDRTGISQMESSQNWHRFRLRKLMYWYLNGVQQRFPVLPSLGRNFATNLEHSIRAWVSDYSWRSYSIVQSERCSFMSLTFSYEFTLRYPLVQFTTHYQCLRSV